MVPGTKLRVRLRMQCQKARAWADSSHSGMLMQPSVLLRMRFERSSACPMLVSQAVVEEVRGRLGNGELDISEHEGVSEMCVNNREEWWV
jgi:hypothetical protein